MSKYLFLSIALFFTMSSYAQKTINYDNPPISKSSDYQISLEDIVSTAEFCKMRFNFTNSTKEAFFLYTTEDFGFDYPAIGTYYPRKKDEIIIHPTDKKHSVIEVNRDMDYRKDFFSLLINGLKKGDSNGYLEPKTLTIQMEKEASFTHEGLSFSVGKLIMNKGKIKIQIEVAYASEDDDMLVFEPSSLNFSANGKPLIIDKSGSSLISFNNKPVTLRPNEKKTLRYTLLSEDTEIECNTFEMFEKFTFTSVYVDPIQIGFPKETKIVENTTTSKCEVFMGEEKGAMKVKVYSSDDACFMLDMDGFPVINRLTSNAIIFLDNGRKSYTLTMADGSKTEGRIIIPSTLDYSQIGYIVKKGKNGYELKYVVRDQVMTSAALQKRQDYFDEAKNKRDDQKNVEVDKSNSSAAAGCFGSDSEGTKTLTLKVTWKGKPVVGHSVEVRYGNVPIGNATTGSDGSVKIKSSAYENSIPKVNVYGCKGNTTWSVTGDWVVFDDSKYFHLKLDEVAKMISEMMGGTVDEIGKSWGL